ncbi:MAG: extracellular solute-binding protein [Limisphaerales bacterium]
MVVLSPEDGMIRALFPLFFLFVTGCAKRDHVVLYTSQDQFYAETILAEFTAATGIEVRPVFDTESAKTAALAHRLRSEKNNPQCDVFWSNEEMHTRFLVRDGVISSNDVKTVGYRTRQVVINTNLLTLTDAPKSLLDLTDEKWRGKVTLAFPLFGTTSAYFMALRQYWGDARWREWCEGLTANDAKVVDGNSMVVRLVGAGESVIGLTDSDDIEAGLRQSLPVAEVPGVAESFVIPNTIAVVSGAPRPALAQRLTEYLADRATLQRLVEIGARDLISVRPAGGELAGEIKVARLLAA